jgi:hypothetical protein
MAASIPISDNLSDKRWLQGPVADVVLGGGLLYVPVLLVLLVGGPGVREAMPFFAVPLLLLLFSAPHIGATLVRVYERPADRQAYSLFAFWATALIAILCVASFFVQGVGSVFITIYLTIVPWHFTGQNYGVALVLLKRQGIEVTPDTKRYVYAAFVLPFALFLLALHGSQPTSVEYAPLNTSGTHFEFLSLGIPGAIQGPAVILGILAYLWVLGECVLRLRGLGSARQLLPGAGVFFSQALWFAAPVIAAVLLDPEDLGPFSQSYAAFTFTWISVMHGAQYLWITNYFVKKERPESTTPRFLLRSMLMGTAIYGIPVLILAPALSGRIAFGGLELMLAAGLNIHHIVLDSAIWKLRNARIAKILLRGGDADGGEIAAPGVPWVRIGVLASGCIGAAFMLLGPAEREFGIRRAGERGDVARMQTASRRMAWMGRDDATLHADIGFRLGQAGDVDGALREFERSNALEPNVVSWLNIGALQEGAGRVDAALAAYEQALALDPDDVSALHYAGRAFLKAGRPERARPLLERAVVLAPERADLREMLAEATPG